jgi:hypothetical protein
MGALMPIRVVGTVLDPAIVIPPMALFFGSKPGRLKSIKSGGKLKGKAL